MQIRRNSYPAEAELPPCPFRHEPAACLQRHGFYERYATPEGNEKRRIPRFLCVLSGRTLSVLPANFLPYRPIGVEAVQDDFDARCDPEQQELGGLPREKDPPDGAIVQGSLRRAWQRFSQTDRLQSLLAHFGQRLPLLRSACQLWRSLRQQVGSLEAMLLELATAGRSLLKDYRCLSPN